MKTPLQIVNEIQIASPCPVAWDSMTGDNFVRHCAECNKSVFDISELTAQRAVDLIREHEGSLCIQLYRRKDGTVLTADCPVGLRERSRRIFRRAAALVASIFTLGLFVGCDSDSDAQLQIDRSQKLQTEKTECHRLAGAIVPPPLPESAQPKPDTNAKDK
jgi:hypothetical protein